MLPSAATPPIAVDHNYLLRDNQFWYTDCAFADLLATATTITLSIAGLGVRDLTRSAQGNNPQPTTSFTLSVPTVADRTWWEQNRGQRIRVELLAIDGTAPPVVTHPPIAPLPPAPMAVLVSRIETALQTIHAALAEIKQIQSKAN